MGRGGSGAKQSWHSALEFELRSTQRFATRAEARPAVAAWIDDSTAQRATQPCDEIPDRLRARTAGGMTCIPTRHGATVLAPSPPGGLRPALNPDYGRRRSAAVQIPPNQVSTVSGIAVAPSQ